MNYQNRKTTTDYPRLRSLVRKKGYKLRRLRNRFAREYDAGYYITDPETRVLVAGDGTFGLNPEEVEMWCKSLG